MVDAPLLCGVRRARSGVNLVNLAPKGGGGGGGGIPLYITAIVAWWDAVRRVLVHAQLGSVRVKQAVLNPWRTLRAGELTEEETALRVCA